MMLEVNLIYQVRVNLNQLFMNNMIFNVICFYWLKSPCPNMQIYVAKLYAFVLKRIEELLIKVHASSRCRNGCFLIGANIALFANVVLITGFMSLLGATLTLPGIAGIVLTIGMAVDANVLIFSRIREELKDGKDPQTAIQEGFSRAFVTIVDANVTTLIASIVLYAIGTGPVKGFAITLSIGILTSMFTAILGTRAIINLMYGNKNIKELRV